MSIARLAAIRLGLVRLCAVATAFTLFPATEARAQAVVQGSFEPDYRYPWVVRLNGCGGVLLSPKWVLTAAHCIRVSGGYVSIHRTAPRGGTHSQWRNFDHTDIRIHPDYVNGEAANDIALIRLRSPFALLPAAQTVGLPPEPRRPGVVGTVASIAHTGELPPGYLSVMRAPTPALDWPPSFEVVATASSGGLCPGDSGSGFITVERGRAIVRGIASLGTISSCQTAANTRADFTDVFHHRDWILDTMRVTNYFLEGNTRLRSSGRLARGVMGIRCVGIPPVWGPLYVRGVEEGSNCANEELQIVACYLEPGQPRLVISQFVMRTIFSDGTVEIESLPFSPSVASYEGIRPFGAYREFDCTISWPNRDFPPDSGSFFPG